MPTDVDRDTVMVMVAAGIPQRAIAQCRRISEKTLRLHYRHELDNGVTAINSMVVVEHFKRIQAGDFQAIRWWEQARMGWTERVVVDSNQSDGPMRVVVELVGQAAPTTIDGQLSKPALTDTARRHVQLVG